MIENPTPNQKRAIEEPGDIIVSAGAGSGKTAVMISRIINKIVNCGASLDEMLIVTFTRSAAADMRFKLAEDLSRLRKDKRYARIAERAVESMPSCNIGTLHGFCQKLIKTYFYAAGIDPSSSICEEGEATAIEKSAVSAAVESAWDSGDPDFAVMYDMLASRRSDDGVKTAVKNILDMALSTSDPQAYLAGVQPDEIYAAELDALLAKKRAALNERIATLKVSLSAAGMAKHVKVIDEFADFMDGRISKVTDTRKGVGDDDTLNEDFKALKSACKEFRMLTDEARAALSENNARYADVLCRVAADALKRYGERKERLGVIDYSDLEHGAYRVLNDEECLNEIARGIKYVFIDEFQDVNPLQSDIAEKLRISVKETFVVGDVKQSIYGFRRCSPEHFIKAIESGRYKHIPLADNFRSSKPVIDFVNGVFSGVMTKSFGGVEYSDKTQRLVYGNKNITGGSAEFVVVPADADSPRTDRISDCVSDVRDDKHRGYSVVTDSEKSAHDGEAVFIADRICKMLVESDPPDIGKIAVLLRSQGAFCRALMRELDERNIKYGLDRKSDAASFPEVVALVDILRCVDNRYDDVALFTALRSPMGGFSDGELAEVVRGGERVLRGVYGGGYRRAEHTLWEKLCAYCGELEEKVARFKTLRDSFAEFSKDHDSAETLGKITSEIDYFQYIYERNGAAQAVEALIDHASERECDTHEFINYFDSTGFGIDASGGGDAVTIITEHSSKGLEYECVIVADTAHKFNERDRYGRVIVSERGVFVKVPDIGTRTLKKTVPWILENMLMPDRTRAEELRLFYVALTRAKKNLLVCGKDVKRKSVVDVRAATRQLDFMANKQPSSPESVLPVGAPSDSFVAPEAERAVTAAVADKIARVENYNAARTGAAPIKTCVTAVARDVSELWESDFAQTDIPTETSEYNATDGETARIRGTAYHKAMELLDFDSPDIGAIASQCDLETVDGKAVLKAAEIMKGLTENAVFVAKERYFTVDLPVETVYGSGRGNMLVQGVIDLLIAYPNGDAVIVDYKTGDPRFFDIAAYAKQLELYKLATERTANYRVTHMYLYSFSANKLLEYPHFRID